MSIREPLRFTTVVSVACLVIGAAGGWWLRGGTAVRALAAEGALPLEKPASVIDTNDSPVLRVGVHESSSAGDSSITPVSFATAIRASLDDRDPFSRGIRIRQLIRALGEADLPAAVGEAARLSDKDRREVLDLLGSRWGEVDVRAGLAFAESARDERIRHSLVSSIVARWATLDPAAAMAWMNVKPGDHSREAALPSIVAGISRSDPASAAQFLAQIPPGDAFERATEALLREWMTTDAPAAIAWVQQLPPGTARRDALKQAMVFWAQQDGKAALDWLARDPSSVRGDSVLSNAIYAWADRAPEDALAWALVQTDEKIRADAVPAAIGALGKVDPARAAELLSKQFLTAANPELAGEIAGSWVDIPELTGGIAGSWANTDAAAAQWAQELPAGEAKSKAFMAVMTNWAQSDSTAAGKWLQQLPAGLERDTAVSGFAWQVFERDREGAMEWIKTVGDPFFRGVQFEAIATRWMKDDPEGATKWVQSTDLLSPAAKKEVLNPSTQGFQVRY